MKNKVKQMLFNYLDSANSLDPEIFRLATIFERLSGAELHNLYLLLDNEKHKK